jgi:hypothetical protein
MAQKVADEAASYNPRPSVFGGARVAAKAAPTKIGFCRRGFSPELPVSDDAKDRGRRRPYKPRTSRFRWHKGSRLKPLLPRSVFVGGASAPNFRPSMARWWRMKPLPTIPGLPPSMAQGSRLKPLLPRPVFVGGAFAPNFRPSMARWWGMKPLPPIPGLPPSMAQGSRLKPLLPNDADFLSRAFPLRWRKGSRRKPLLPE